MKRIIINKQISEVKNWGFPEITQIKVGLMQSDLEKKSEVEQTSQSDLEQRAYAEAVAKYSQQMVQKLEEFDQIISQLEQPLANLEHQIEQEIMQFILSILKKLVGENYKTDPQKLLAIIKEAIQLLPSSQQTIELFLHPDDIALVKDKLISHENLKIKDDLSLKPGECRVKTEQSEINASLQERLNKLCASFFHHEAE